MQRKSFIAGLSGLFLADTASGEPMNLDISIPGDGSALNGVVPVTIQASPTKNLERVVLEIDGVLVGSDAADPYVFSWDTTTVADGQHTISAKAHYRNRTSSGSLQVWVANVVVEPPPEWTKVADEGGNFTLTETQEVRYGANGVYNTKVLAVGTYACTNTFFGDPIVGVRKVCEARDTIAEPPTSGWPASFYTGPAGQNIILPPKQGVWLGTAQGTYNGKSPEQQIAELEAFIGRKIAVEHRFIQSPNACTPLDAGLINAIVQRGHVPYISWNPNYFCNEIIAGQGDSCLRAFGAAIAAQPHKLILRPYSEFDGNWRKFSKNSDGSMATTAQFVQMWRRSIDKLREGGAFPKASVYLCSSHGYYARPVWINAQQAIADIGPSYYDWVGVDGYGGDTRQYREINGLVECEQDFRGKKPIMHGETSAKEKAGDPNWKGNWWRGARDYIKASMPGLLSMNVFDVAYTDGDWRIATSEASKQGFKDLASDAYFKP